MSYSCCKLGSHFTSLLTYDFYSQKISDIDLFQKYLIPAQESNQFSNYGNAVRLLEDRAREMLKIDDSKAVIATSSGSSAISGIIYTLLIEKKARVLE